MRFLLAMAMVLGATFAQAESGPGEASAKAGEAWAKYLIERAQRKKAEKKAQAQQPTYIRYQGRCISLQTGQEVPEQYNLCPPDIRASCKGYFYSSEYGYVQCQGADCAGHTLTVIQSWDEKVLNGSVVQCI